MTADPQHLSPYLHFFREQWAHLRDSVPLSLTEQDLIDLYHIQLEDYAAALERMLQKKVKETYIYSFTLRKMIPLS